MRNFLFFLMPATKSNLFITKGAAAGATFHSPERTERRNSAVTLQNFTKMKRKGELIQMHDFSLFPKRCKMRAAAMSLALEGSFAEHYHKHVCILKAGASDLHSERHKTSAFQKTWYCVPGQAVAFWDVLAIKNKQKLQYKNRLRNKILKYH